MKIVQIVVNWFYTNEVGEEYVTYEPGVKNVRQIDEHQAQGDGDRWYCDVIYHDGKILRLFNVNSVSFDIEKRD